MGNCGQSAKTKAQKSYNLTKYKGTIEALGLSQTDAQQLFDFFAKVDEDGSGEVSIYEFFDYLDVDRSKFSKRAFGLFDEDGSGEIDFQEFVVALWSYCTYDKSSLTNFAFDLYDLDASGLIDVGEMQQIVKEVYGNNFRTSVYAQRIMEKIHVMGGGGDGGLAEISREQFAKFTSKHPALLFPAFQLQNTLQKKIMGVKFWDAASERRYKKFGHAANLQDFLQQITAEAFSSLVDGDAAPQRVQGSARTTSVKVKPASSARSHGSRSSRSSRSTSGRSKGVSSSSARYLTGRQGSSRNLNRGPGRSHSSRRVAPR